MRRFLLWFGILSLLGFAAYAEGAKNCAYPEKCGGQVVPGLNGSDCNDECFRYIDNMPTADGGIPANAFHRHWYFSAYNGKDGNKGTRENPFQTMAKFETMCEVQNTRCTLIDDGSVWSPNQLTFDTSTAIFAGAFQIDEAVTWGASCPGGNTGTVIGRDPGLGIVSVERTDTGQTAPVATNHLCSVDGSVDLTISTVTDTASIGSILFDMSLTGCDRTDAPCYLAEGENPDNPARINFDRTAQSSAIFFISDDGSNVGSALVQNLWCDLPVEDCFGTDDGANTGGVLYAHNVKAISFNTDGASENHNGFTTHVGGYETVTGRRSFAKSYTTSTTGAGSPVAPTGTGGMNWLSTGSVVNKCIQDDCTTPVMGITGGDIVVIGGNLYRESGGRGGVLFVAWSSTNANEPFVIRTARMSGWGTQDQNSAGLSYSASSDWDDTVDFEISMYETSLVADRCLSIGNTKGATFTYTGRGVVFDDCPNNTVLISTTTGSSFDVEGVYDPDDSGTLGNIDSSSCATQAACQSALSGISGNFFANNSFDSTSGADTDGVAWSEDDYPTGSISATFAATSPPTISCAACDFVSDGLADGDLVGITSANIQPQNGTVFQVDTVATTQLTLDPDETVVAEGPTSSVTWKKWTYPQLAVHPEHNAFNQSISTYTIQLPTRVTGGTIPKWYTPALQEIRSFTFQNGLVGGR